MALHPARPVHASIRGPFPRPPDDGRSDGSAATEQPHRSTPETPSLESQLAAARDGACRLARCLGLPEPDAEDVAHQALLECLVAVRGGSYQSARGPVEQWFRGVVRHRVVDHWRRAARLRSRMTCQDVTQLTHPRVEVGASDTSGSLSEQMMLSLALDELDRASTTARRGATAIRAAIAGRGIRATARRLGTTPAILSLAKHRALAQLELIVHRVARASRMA